VNYRPIGGARIVCLGNAIPTSQLVCTDSYAFLARYATQSAVLPRLSVTLRYRLIA